MTAVVGENLDRLASVEMRRQDEPYRGVSATIVALIRAALGEPSSTAAARLLLEASPGDHVIMTTGAGIAPWMPKGEVDGPPGLAALARTLWFGRGVVSVFVVAENHREIMEATLLGMEMNVLPPEMAAVRYWPASVVEVMPYGTADGAWVSHLYDRYRPTALVASEKLGPNANGIIHSGTGIPWPIDEEIDAAALFAEARRRGTPSVGIGDGGNELGYGLIRAALDERFGDQRRCACPCNGTVTCDVAADVLLHAGNSDWGAYAIAAAVAFLLRDPPSLVSTELVTKGLEACVAAGGVGRYGRRVDLAGTGLAAQQAMLTLAREIIEVALSRQPSRPY